MKKLLLKYLFASLLLIGCLFNYQKSFGQTIVTIGPAGGYVSSTITTNSQIAIYGISVQVASGSVTFKQFNIGGNGSNSAPNAVFANGTLYRSTSSTFSGPAPGVTPVGNVTISASTNSTSFNITDLSETISNTTMYYYLVVDIIGSGSFQPYVNNDGNNFATDVNNNPYKASSGSFPFYNISPSTVYPIQVTNATVGLSPTTTSLVSGTSTAVKLFGFGLKATATSTFSTINIKSNVSNLGSYFNTFKLYSSATNDASTATAVAGVTGTVIAGNYLQFSGTIPASTTITYYYLVANCVVTGGPTIPQNIQFSLIDQQPTAALTRTSPTPTTNYSDFTIFGNTYTVNAANVTLTSQQNGLAATGTAITNGETDIAMFGFGITASSTLSVSTININSNSSSLSTYFGNGKLYSCTSGTYSTGTRTLVGTVAFSGNYAVATLTTPLSVGTTQKFLFLVADDIGGGSPAPTVAFDFTSGQSSPAVVESTPTATNYNNFSITGGTYTLPLPTINFAINNTGFTTPSTLVLGQTGIVLYGVTFTPTGNITINSPYINFNTTNGNPIGTTGYFPSSSLQLWMSTTGSFATATQVSGVTYQFSSAIQAFLPGGSITLNAGTSYTYYLVGTFGNVSSGLPTTLPISVNGFNSNGGGTNYSGSIATTTYNLVDAVVSVGDNNSAASGVYQGTSLAYGQLNIVLFGFSVTAQGNLTIRQMDIPSGNAMGNYFTNGRIYRSTDQYFSDAQLITTTSPAAATVNFNQGAYVDITNFGQTFSVSAPTTYYYFLVADFNKSTTFTAPTTVQYNFTSSQSPTAINTGSGTGDAFNGFTTTGGKLYNIVKSYDWIGTTSDFTSPANFNLLGGGGAGSVPTGSVTVNIGTNVTWTNAPVIPSGASATTTVGGLSFGNKKANPSITIASGKTLTVSNTLDVLAGTNATITGPGTVSLSSTNTATVVSGTTLNLGGAAQVTAAGNFTMAPTSILDVTGSSTLTNSGTMTLQSDATGSASVGQITGSVAGNVNVQRYMSGGTGKRGYRFLSSPVFTSTINTTPSATSAYYLFYLQATTPITGWGTGTYSATQPSNALDQTSVGNPSAFFYYEPDAEPTSKSIAVSDYKAFNTIGDLLPMGNGFLFFFRGNRTLTASKFTAADVPENTTLNYFGVLGQSDIKVYIPGAAQVISSGGHTVYSQATTSATGFTTAFSNTLHTGSNTDGLHLIGNPYPSTIDLDEVLSTGIPASPGLVNKYAITLNNDGSYSGYLMGSGGTATSGRYIAQGQGFFVRANNGATVTFHENQKVTTGYNAPTGVFAATSGTVAPSQVLNIKLSSIDSLNTAQTTVQFGYQNASNMYADSEDLGYITGPLQTTYLTSYTSDNKPCLINQMSTLDSVSSITLYAQGPTSGRYTLNFSGALSLDPRYRVYLKDALMKDSLDVSNNTTYTFNMDLTNPLTYGDKRFTLSVSRVAAAYALTDFKAIKNTSSVILTWATANESNYTGFIVQRSTDGGKTYTAIGSLLSDGSGAYTYTDTTPATNGINLYKLAQNNIYELSNVTLSNAVSVSYLTVNPTNNKLVVFPNPVATTIKVAIAASTNGGTLALKIYNIRGEVMLRNTFSQGSTPSMDVSKLIQGTYIIKVNDDKTDYGSATFTKL